MPASVLSASPIAKSCAVNCFCWVIVNSLLPVKIVAPSNIVLVKPISSVPPLPVPVAAPLKVPSNNKPSLAPTLIVPASPCKVSRVKPVAVCVSFTIEVAETSNTAPFLITTAPLGASMLIVPALNTCVLSKLGCEFGNVILLPMALKLALAPIKIACVGSYG